MPFQQGKNEGAYLHIGKVGIVVSMIFCFKIIAPMEASNSYFFRCMHEVRQALSKPRMEAEITQNFRALYFKIFNPS